MFLTECKAVTSLELYGLSSIYMSPTDFKRVSTSKHNQILIIHPYPNRLKHNRIVRGPSDTTTVDNQLLVS